MRANYRLAADRAYQTLSRLNIRTLPVDPLEIIRKCKNTRVHTFDELMEQYGVYNCFDFKRYWMEDNDAVTLRKESNGVTVYEMFYDSHEMPRRIRFTLAHELGHIILNHRMEEKWEEEEANCFASQLLAPRPVFGMLALRNVDTDDVDLMADIFRISKSAARIAIETQLDQPVTELHRSIFFQFADYISSITNCEDLNDEAM